MESLEMSWASSVIEVVGLVATSVLGYFVTRNDKRLDDAEVGVQTVRNKLNDHMIGSEKRWTDAERRFAKEATLQSTLERLHSRLDGTATKDDVIELRNDIKQLIMRAVKS